MDKKIVVILHPVSDNLMQLKEIFEKDPEIDVFEAEETKEAIEIFRTMYPALWLAANAKKCLEIIGNDPKKVKAFNSKIVLVTNIKLTPKIEKKMNQLGIKDIIYEPIVPKTLHYKINLLLRSLPTAKKKGDREVKKVLNTVNPSSGSEISEKASGKNLKLEQLLANGDDFHEEVDALSFFDEKNDNDNDKDKNKNLDLNIVDDSDDDNSHSKKDKNANNNLNFFGEMNDFSPLKNSSNLDLGIEMDMDEDADENKNKQEKDPLGNLLDEDNINRYKKNGLDLGIEDDTSNDHDNKNLFAFAVDDSLLSEHEKKNFDLNIEDDDPSLKKNKDLIIDRDDEDENLYKKKKRAGNDLSLFAEEDEEKNKSLLLAEEENEKKGPQLGSLGLEDDTDQNTKSNLDLMLEDDLQKNKRNKFALDLLEDEDLLNENKDSLSTDDEDASKDKLKDLDFLPEDESENKDDLLNDLDDKLNQDGSDLGDFTIEDDTIKKSDMDGDFNLEEDEDKSQNKEKDNLDLEVTDSDVDKSKDKINNLDFADEDLDKKNNYQGDGDFDLSPNEKDEKDLDDNLLEEDKKEEIVELELEEEKKKLKDSLTFEMIGDEEKTPNLGELVDENEESLDKKSLDLNLENADDLSKGKKGNLEVDDDFSKNDLLAQMLQIDSSWDFIKEIIAKNLDNLSPEQKIALFASIENNHWKKTPEEMIDLKNLIAKKGEGSLDNYSQDIKIDSINLLTTNDLLKVNHNSQVFMPESKGMTYMIEISLKLLNKKLSSKDILLEISKIIYTEKKGLVDFISYHPIENTFDDLCLSDLENKLSQKNDWENYKKKNASVWKKLFLPKWKDENFKLENQEFIFPFSSKDHFLGLALVNFPQKISAKDGVFVEVLLEMSRSIFIEQNYIILSKNSPEISNIKTTKKSLWRKILNAFGFKKF